MHRKFHAQKELYEERKFLLIFFEIQALNVEIHEFCKIMNNFDFCFSNCIQHYNIDL